MHKKSELLLGQKSSPQERNPSLEKHFAELSEGINIDQFIKNIKQLHGIKDPTPKKRQKQRNKAEEVFQMKEQAIVQKEQVSERMYHSKEIQKRIVQINQKSR